MSARFLVMRHHSRTLGPEFLCGKQGPGTIVDWGRIDNAQAFDAVDAASWVKRLGGRAVPA